MLRPVIWEKTTDVLEVLSASIVWAKTSQKKSIYKKFHLVTNLQI